MDRGKDRLASLSDGLEENARVAARRARSRLRDGAEAFHAAEDSVTRTVKAHPIVSGIAGAGFACLVIAAVLWLRRDDFSSAE